MRLPREDARVEPGKPVGLQLCARAKPELAGVVRALMPLGESEAAGQVTQRDSSVVRGQSSSSFGRSHLHDSLDCTGERTENTRHGTDDLSAGIESPIPSQGSQKNRSRPASDASAQSGFYIEEKIDGERMQMHLTEQGFAWFTRRHTDYSARYRVLERWIRSGLDPAVGQVVLDGEMVVFDPVRGVRLPFGTLPSLPTSEPFQDQPSDPFQQETPETPSETSSDTPRPLFLVFDLLSINGRDLLETPLSERRRVLRAIISDVPGRLEILPYQLGSTEADIRLALTNVMENRYE